MHTFVRTAAGSTIANTGQTAGNTVAGVDDASAEGSVVLSADAQTLGTVQSVQPTADGKAAVVINLDAELGLPVAQVRVMAAAGADGAYELAMSRAEFVSAVNAQIENAAQTQTN